MKKILIKIAVTVLLLSSYISVSNIHNCQLVKINSDENDPGSMH